MTIAFKLENQDFRAVNGGPHFTYSPAISLVANCKTQREIDDLWRKLGAGGRIDQCGWLQDKFGVSWQIVPADIGKLVQDSRDGQADRVTQAILSMRKIDVAALKRATR
jgi:predicted 3-demethylubiquinone-9 3-methyltransferase (glyoxalase superfamily)